MRRGIPCLLAMTVLAWLSPAIRAQYPYPYPQSAYGQMPMQPMPYGYSQPMPPPGYGPSPMYPQSQPMPRQPLYYYPAMPQQMPQQPQYSYQPAPRVINYGPLSDASIPMSGNGAPSYMPAPAPSSGVAPVQMVSRPMLPPTGSLPASSTGVVRTGANGAPIAEEGCGAPGCAPEGCASGACGDACEPARVGIPHTTLWPRGHFIADTGAIFWVPYPQYRDAYTTKTANGNSSTTTFDHNTVDVAPFFQLGYVWHSGWGIRADFWFLHSDDNLSTTNTDPTTTITTPVAKPFQITSPGAGLINGVGIDTLNFTRAFDFKVVDFEVIKEFNCFDMFFLFGGGVRYSHIEQSYYANRSNAGGTNAAGTSVSVDTEQLGVTSRYDGVGPTWSFEAVHPIRGSCVSLYGNVRGSFLFGTEQLNQDYTLNSVVSPAGAAAIFTNTTQSGPHTTTRFVPVVDLETGIQFGKRCGPCYVWCRAGVSYGRWWDVGSPTSDNGSLDMFGGALKCGLIY